MVGAALEDFGLRRARPVGISVDVDEDAPAPEALPEAPAPAPEPVTVAGAELSPGVVFHGAARRSTELQRFCDHLAARRAEPLTAVE